MDQTSRHTDKNIYQMQNQEFILKALVVQGKLYRKAKIINGLSFLICILLPIGYSIIKTFLSGEVLIAIGILFSVAVMIVSPFLSKCSEKQRNLGAKVQQTIDCYLFANNNYQTVKNDWGVFTENELTELIAKTKITEKDIDQKKNWYNDYSSYPHAMQAYYSQCECVRWDGDLRKYYIYSLYCCGIIALVFVVVLAVALGMTVFEFIVNFATFIPLVKYYFPLLRQLKDDRLRLSDVLNFQREIDSSIDNINNEKLYIKVYEMQQRLYEHRKKALLVPDFFYKICRNKQQDVEDKISSEKANGGEL